MFEVARKLISLAVALGIGGGGYATLTPESANAQVTVSTFDGGTVVTKLTSRIKVNDGSSLSRSWVVLNDAQAPVTLEGVGITTAYNDRYSFRLAGSVTARETVAALEVRVLLFDIFGNHMKTLSGTQVRDREASMTFDADEIGSWRAQENEVSEVLTTVSFVARVRTMEGRIWSFDADVINEELRKIKLQVSEGALDPTAGPTGS